MRRKHVQVLKKNIILIQIYLGVRVPVSPPIPPPPNNPPSAYVVKRKLWTIKLAKAETPTMAHTPGNEKPNVWTTFKYFNLQKQKKVVKEMLVHLREETGSRLSASSWLSCCPPCSPFSGTSVRIWRPGSRWPRKQSQQSSRPGQPAAELKVKVNVQFSSFTSSSQTVTTYTRMSCKKRIFSSSGI